MVKRMSPLIIRAFALVFLFVSTTTRAQTDIDDVQVYDSLGGPASPFAGLNVTVRGTLTVVRGTYDASTYYVQDATGGIAVSAPTLGLFSRGDRMEILGQVGSSRGEILLGSPVVTFLGFSGEPNPLALTLAQTIDNDGSGTQTAADYEIVGTLVSVTGTAGWIGGSPPGSPSQGVDGVFALVDGPDSLRIFLDRETHIDSGAVGNGDAYEVVGIVRTVFGQLELVPRDQLDLIENPQDPSPFITDVTPTPWTPASNQQVVVSAQITDDGFVNSATLYYQTIAKRRAFTSEPMSNTGGDTYEATIPGTTDSGIEYYIEAQDNTGNTSRAPAGGETDPAILAVGLTSIIDVQSQMIPETDQSQFIGDVVNVEAIITVAPGELDSGAEDYVVADGTGGLWSGLHVFEGTGANILFRGDIVRIAGTIRETNGTTEIQPLRADAVELVDFGHSPPAVGAYPTAELDSTESLESVIVRTFVSATEPGTDDWIMVDQISGMGLLVHPAPAVSYRPSAGDALVVSGLLDTHYGNRLIPRDDSDIQQFTSSENVELPPPALSMRAHPNPFNPCTAIEFRLPHRGHVQLVILSVRGERVHTLVDGELPVGVHSQLWRGVDDQGVPVASGVYYARLRLNGSRESVIKLTLVR